VILIENVAVATVDPAGTEYGDGHVVVGDDGRIVAVGPRATYRSSAGALNEQLPLLPARS
jgi:cytosine/adenosine deaminase-related metal-dependent hydrolase